MSSDLFCPIKNNQFSYRQLNSKFYAFIYKTSSSNEVIFFLNKLKEKYSDASHICYAYRLFDGFNLLNDINILEYSHDDGEPRGSSGPPILKILKRYKLINTSIFVVRYFGGKKLGVPGLIEAYSNSADGLIDNKFLKAWFLSRSIKLEYPYNLENILNSLFKKFNISIIEQNFNSSINVTIELNELDFDSFKSDISKLHTCRIKEN